MSHPLVRDLAADGVPVSVACRVLTIARQPYYRWFANAAMKSFFSLLQKDVLNRRVWATREELRIAIVTWTERTYHRRRRQDALDRLTPVEYELIMSTPAAQVA